MCSNGYTEVYSLYGIHGNMKAAPVFQRKKTNQP